MGETKLEAAIKAGSISDPAYQKAVFEQAYAETCLQLDEGRIDNDIRALRRSNESRNQRIDEVTAFFASESGAECGSACSSCCHQMVLCTPLEIFDIARRILDARPASEIARIKERLARLAPLPLDVESRYGADKPCALLEDNRCSIYEHRPSLCRTMLSTSRAACEASLNLEAQAVPFIPEPIVISFMTQMGIDYALIKLKHLSTEKVEMSRALSIALNGFGAAFLNWINGREAFPNCHADTGSAPSNRDLAEMAAAHCGVV